jgi:hypothetical protein
MPGQVGIALRTRRRQQASRDAPLRLQTLDVARDIDVLPSAFKIVGNSRAGGEQIG